MHKVSLKTAVKMTGKSESTIRRDVKSGKVSTERDDRGHLKFDIAELQRAYGELKSTVDDAKSTEQGNGNVMTGHDDAENYRAPGETDRRSPKSQLERAEARETKLLNLTDRLTMNALPTPKRPSFIAKPVENT